MQNDLPYRNLDLYANDLAEIQISVGEVIDPSWRGDVAKVTSIEIQISVVEVIDPPWRGDVAKVTSIEIQISVGEVIEGRGGGLDN